MILEFIPFAGLLFSGPIHLSIDKWSSINKYYDNQEVIQASLDLINCVYKIMEFHISNMNSAQKGWP